MAAAVLARFGDTPLSEDCRALRRGARAFRPRRRPDRIWIGREACSSAERTRARSRSDRHARRPRQPRQHPLRPPGAPSSTSPRSNRRVRLVRIATGDEASPTSGPAPKHPRRGRSSSSTGRATSPRGTGAGASRPRARQEPAPTRYLVTVEDHRDGARANIERRSSDLGHDRAADVRGGGGIELRRSWTPLSHSFEGSPTGRSDGQELPRRSTRGARARCRIRRLRCRRPRPGAARWPAIRPSDARISSSSRSSSNEPHDRQVLAELVTRPGQRSAGAGTSPLPVEQTGLGPAPSVPPRRSRSEPGWTDQPVRQSALRPSTGLVDAKEHPGTPRASRPRRYQRCPFSTVPSGSTIRSEPDPDGPHVG